MILTALQVETLPTDLQTVEEFEQWERQHITKGSYEFVRGQIIEKDAMKQAEFFYCKVSYPFIYYNSRFSKR